MRIEVDFRLEDLEELYVPEVYAAKPSQYVNKMRTGVGAWLLFVAAAVFLWIFNTRLHTRLGPPPQNPARDLQTDVFTLILPGGLGLLLTCVLLFRVWRGSKWKPAVRGAPAATKNHRKRFYAVLIWFIIAVIAFACINGAFTQDWRPAKGSVFLLCWGPWLASLILLMSVTARSAMWTARRTWFTTPAFARHHTFEFDDWGLKLWTDVTRTEMHWSTFERARETQNLLVLVAETKLQYLIPKRAFASEADLNSARALLQNKLENTTFLASHSGFPVATKQVVTVASNP